MNRSKGPKDEGLGLLKKCEEISRHLSGGTQGESQKKPSRGRGHDSRGSNPNPNHCCCASSRPQLSLEQIDALLGTDLVNYIPDRFLLGTGNHRRSPYDSGDNHQVAPASSCQAMSYDELALFVYKHGFHDPLQDESRLLPGHTNYGASRRRRKGQEELLKAGILRILAMLLKQIHSQNFYRFPQDKIANAFTISIEKERVDREGLSTDWEFFGANHHPKIPLKDKIMHTKISQELLNRTAKRVTGSASKKPSSKTADAAIQRTHHSKLATRGISAPAPVPTNKNSHGKPAIRRRTPSSNSNASRLSCTQATQGAPAIQGGARKRRFRVTNKNCDLPLHILGLAAPPATQDINHREFSDPRLALTTGEIENIEAWASDLESAKLSGFHRPRSSTSSLALTSAPDHAREDLDRGGRARHLESAKLGGLHRKRPSTSKVLKMRKGELKALIMAGVPGNSLVVENASVGGGLSTLARIDRMFPAVPKEEKPYSRAQVEIDRLKIMRW